MAKKQHQQSKNQPLPVAERRASQTQAFNPDYTYVINNLKKIGVMAVCFIAILVALSFIL